MTTPTNKQVIDFILARFNESELKLFVISYFPEAENAWGNGMNKNDKVIELLAYCRRRDLMESLLIALEHERPDLFQKAFPKQPKVSPIPTQYQSEQKVKEKPAQQKTDQNTFIHEKTGVEFIRIPEGRFVFGGDDEDEWGEVKELPEFWISKTPVTQAAYQRFIDANRTYKLPFVKEDWAKPYNWDRVKRTHPEDKADHPVVLVSWYDAIAFCEWAGLQLPTEEQWEKAARGTDGRKYPWGNNDPTDKLCNFGRDVGGTTPVRFYSPQGDSPYGCMDMSGNVWEWCLNKYDNSLNIKIDKSSDTRVLRGGSWTDDQNEVCGTYRFGDHPNERDCSGGFRMVYCSPSQ